MALVTWNVSSMSVILCLEATRCNLEVQETVLHVEEQRSVSVRPGSPRARQIKDSLDACRAEA